MSEAIDTHDQIQRVKALAAQCNPKHVQVIEAILSGDYSDNTAAYQSVYPKTKVRTASANVARMLAIANNSTLFDALRELRLLDSIMTRTEAMAILSDMARTSMGDLVEFGTYQVTEDALGNPVYQSVWTFKNSSELTEAQLRSINELNATKEGLKIKQHDQKAAMKQLAEMAGWEAPKKVEHSGGPITHIESAYVDP
ncbi:MAG: terminase small subunit [Pseudomonadota bacterium]